MYFVFYYICLKSIDLHILTVKGGDVRNIIGKILHIYIYSQKKNKDENSRLKQKTIEHQ